MMNSVCFAIFSMVLPESQRPIAGEFRFVWQARLTGTKSIYFRQNAGISKTMIV